MNILDRNDPMSLTKQEILLEIARQLDRIANILEQLIGDDID